MEFPQSLIEKSKSEHHHTVKGYFNNSLVAEVRMHEEYRDEHSVVIYPMDGALTLQDTHAYVELLRRVLAEAHTCPPLVHNRSKTL